MGRFEKFMPIGYVTPGMERRFMPKAGSGYTFCFTRAATTVVGTVTAYHPVGWKRGVESTSPRCCTLAEDCSVHPSRKESLDSVCGCRVGDCCAERREQREQNIRHSKPNFIKAFFGRKIKIRFKGAPLPRPSAALN